MKRISAVVVLVGCALACMLAGCGGGQSAVDENSIKASFKDGVLHVTMNLRASATGVKVAVM